MLSWVEAMYSLGFNLVLVGLVLMPVLVLLGTSVLYFMCEAIQYFQNRVLW